jgi:hypothetical protein
VKAAVTDGVVVQPTASATRCTRLPSIVFAQRHTAPEPESGTKARFDRNNPGRRFRIEVN